MNTDTTWSMPRPGHQRSLGQKPDSTSCLGGKRTPLPPESGIYGNHDSRLGLKEAPGVSQQVGLFNNQVNGGGHRLWLNTGSGEPIYYHCHLLFKLGNTIINKICDGNENTEED